MDHRAHESPKENRTPTTRNHHNNFTSGLVQSLWYHLEYFTEASERRNIRRMESHQYEPGERSVRQ